MRPPETELNTDKDLSAGTRVVSQVVQPVQDIPHDLRTRLAIITLLSGNLDLLYERLDDVKRRKMIRDLRMHTRVLNDLASDLLTQLPCPPAFATESDTPGEAPDLDLGL